MPETVVSPMLSVNPRDALTGFLNKCEAVGGIDIETVRDIATTTVTYLSGTAEVRKERQVGQILEQRWYDSLATKKPDWSVYETDYYLGELWACWAVYSRSYLRSIQKPSSLPSAGGVVADLGEVKKIVDLGCGFGYTTAALTEMFPGASVFGTNIDGTVQMKLARLVGEQCGFKMASGLSELEGNNDLVFASEYFEHVQAPIQHLQDVIRALSPKAMLIANAFGTRAVGHFEFYTVDGKWMDGKATSKRFDLEMKRWGYMKIKTGLWNNRPCYWKRMRKPGWKYV